jgi:hypothetical protein
MILEYFPHQIAKVVTGTLEVHVPENLPNYLEETKSFNEAEDLKESDIDSPDHYAISKEART